MAKTQIHAAKTQVLDEKLSLTMLGPPTISWVGQPIHIPRRQSRALLYRLAAANQPLSRDHLCFLIWPDASQSVARRNLSVVLSQLRRVLPIADLLVCLDDTVAIRAEAVATDTAAFNALAPEALREGRLNDLAAATRLYRGPFLDGFVLTDAAEFDGWVYEEQQSWQRRYLDTLAALVAGYRAVGAYPEAIAAARLALATDPLAEELHRDLIALYATQGDRVAALRQFEHCVVVLERELGVDPLPETRALYEAVLDGQYQPAPTDDNGTQSVPNRAAPVAPQFAPARPPIPLGALVGREQELLTLRTLIDSPDGRLITLTGPGGCGKTRLALELVRQLEQHMPDSVVFVPLASLRDPALVLDTVAQACGATGASVRSPIAALQAILSNRRVLLVLDNLEHLLPAAPALTTLLAGLPELRLLVTSRHVLHLSGEQVFPVPPLPLPDLTDLPTLEALAAQPAIALLVTRTRALHAQFALKAENATALATICVRLDGLPLALELAAARLRLMPAHALLRRLDRRLSLLTQGPHDLPERHRTLRSVITWSEELLSSAARALFHATASCVGSWTLDVAEALGRATGHPELRTQQGVLDAVADLIDASLVQQVFGSDGEPRMELLETIREYALERLQAQGAVTRIADTHALWYAQHAALASFQLGGATSPAWLDRIADDEPNLLVALEHAHNRTQPATELQLLEALVQFWSIRGQLHEGRYWVERTLWPLVQAADRSAAWMNDAISAQLARVCLLNADLLFMQGEYISAIPYLETSVAHWRSLNQPGSLAIALMTLAGAHELSGDPATSADLFAEGEALARSSDDAAIQAWLALDYGRNFRHRGQPRAARRWLSMAAKYYQAAGDQRLLVQTLLDLTPVLLALGEEAMAETYAAEALEIARQLRSQGVVANALNELGEIARYQGRDAEASAYYTESLLLLRRMGNRSEEPRLQHNLAQLALRRGELRTAATAFAEILAVFSERQIERGVMECLISVGMVATALEQPLDAARLWGAAAELGAASSWELWPPDQLAYASAVAQARMLTTLAAFEAAWHAGRQLSLAEACALAVEIAQLP